MKTFTLVLFLQLTLCFAVDQEVRELQKEIQDIKAMMVNMYKVNENLEMQVKQLKKQVEDGKSQNNVVAFVAFLDDDVDVEDNTIVPFTRVSVNEGGGYESSNSRFVCPVTGLYMFTITTMTAEETASTQIIRSDGSTDSKVATSFNTSDNWDSSSNTGVTICNAGNTVFVKNVYSSAVYFRASRDEDHQQSNYVTSFSGFLISLS